MQRLTAVLALTLTLGLVLTGCDSSPVGTESQPDPTHNASQQGPMTNSHGGSSGNRATIAVVSLKPPEPEDSNIRGQLTITDDGQTVSVTGSATGLDPEKNYISLFYGVGSTATGPLACEALIVPSNPGNPKNALRPDQMHVGGWKTSPTGSKLRALAWPKLFEGFAPGKGYSGKYKLQSRSVEMKDNTPGNAVPDYVPIERVGTISIRDLSVKGPKGRAGFGPDAVVACGKVVRISSMPFRLIDLLRNSGF